MLPEAKTQNNLPSSWTFHILRLDSLSRRVRSYNYFALLLLPSSVFNDDKVSIIWQTDTLSVCPLQTFCVSRRGLKETGGRTNLSRPLSPSQSARTLEPFWWTSLTDATKTSSRRSVYVLLVVSRLPKTRGKHLQPLFIFSNSKCTYNRTKNTAVRMYTYEIPKCVPAPHYINMAS